MGDASDGVSLYLNNRQWFRTRYAESHPREASMKIESSDAWP